MKIIQQRFDASHSLIIGSECEVSTMRQTALSEFIMDIAWLLKEPSAENSQQMMTSFQIQRINSLLNFLLHHESIIILDKILKNLKIMMDKKEANGMVNGTSDTDMRLLQSYMDYASNIRHEKLQRSEVLKHQLNFLERRIIAFQEAAVETTRNQLLSPLRTWSKDQMVYWE
ncbi:hypothetical protein BDE02_08G179400 [Populus trichocarpa]|nr:hypothetical protein BDE02_08G179400 [Populus trichocarpa]